MPAPISTLNLVALLIASQELGRGGFLAEMAPGKKCWGDKNCQSADSKQSVFGKMILFSRKICYKLLEILFFRNHIHLFDTPNQWQHQL